MDQFIINSLLTGYLLIGVISILGSNVWYGGIHFFLLIGSLILVAYSYCAKCPSCQKTCGHPQIGVLRRLVPKRDQSRYQMNDYAGLAPFIFIGIILPQYWLWQNKVLFIIFWILNVAVLIGIITRLCGECKNKQCVLNRNARQGREKQ
ncbi:MAG: hypothetical protein MI862_25015 [Desulfobacterales bacterium]|nr:hypothetical protein [Desulfobacterales bacterium]